MMNITIKMMNITGSMPLPCIIPLYNAGPKFRGTHPKKISGAKNMQNLADFGRLWSSAVNVSEMDEDIKNRIFTLSTAIPPALGETSPVNFGPVTFEISMWTCTHLHFSEEHISAPTGCCAPKFLHALENDQVLLAHPHRGRRFPLQLFSKGGQKLA